MSSKSVTFRLTDNTTKYKKLIEVLIEAGNIPEIVSTDFLRNIFRKVFLYLPSSSEILQFRHFLHSRREVIVHHISLALQNSDELIILSEQKCDIYNKLMLHYVIVNLEIDIPHFGHTLVNSIMNKAWGSELPLNAVSLVKAFLTQQYRARKSNEDMSVPAKCRGYHIIQDNLVHFDSDEPLKKKFCLLNISEKVKTMLIWLGFTGIALKNVLLKSYILSNLNEIRLADAFLDDEVDATILKYFMKKKMYNKFLNLVNEGISRNIYVCGQCENPVDGSVRCDSCLRWYHYECVSIDDIKKNDLKYEDGFCPKCK